MTGAERIAAERQRQIDTEGWTVEHDDLHNHGELVDAALSYAVHARYERTADQLPSACWWPWMARVGPRCAEGWKPSADPIRNLEKAGALIAAEIDRLTRKAETGDSRAVTADEDATTILDEAIWGFLWERRVPIGLADKWTAELVAIVLEHGWKREATA